jgi:hypothetical protein
MADSQSTEVIDHLWWGDTLEVAVHGSEYGKSFRVQFRRSIDGVLKLSGGGGYKRQEKDAFDRSVEAAKAWVCEGLGYDVVLKDEWSRTKATRGMRHRDKQELTKLTPEQRRDLAAKLRSGEIDLVEPEDQQNAHSVDTGIGQEVGGDG